MEGVKKSAFLLSNNKIVNRVFCGAAANEAVTIGLSDKLHIQKIVLSSKLDTGEACADGHATQAKACGERTNVSRQHCSLQSFDRVNKG